MGDGDGEGDVMGDLGGETPGTDAVAGLGDPIGGGIGNDASSIGQGGLGDSIMDFLGEIPPSLLGLLGMITGQPALGILGVAASMGQGNGGQATGSGLGSSIGGAIGGIPGAAIGSSVLGNAVGAVPAMSGADVAAANASNSDPGNAAGRADMDGVLGSLGSLASLWQWNQNRRDLNGLAGSLQEMYGQNSPYANALRSKLSAQDAARGRRSGGLQGRETALQAELAKAMSGQAGTLSQIFGQKNANNQQMFQNMFGLAKMMGGLPGMQSKFKSLMDLFNSNNIGGSPVDGRVSGDISPNNSMGDWSQFIGGNSGGVDFGSLGFDSGDAGLVDPGFGGW